MIGYAADNTSAKQLVLLGRGVGEGLVPVAGHVLVADTTRAVTLHCPLAGLSGSHLPLVSAGWEVRSRS